MSEVKEAMKPPVLFSPSEVGAVIDIDSRGFSVPIYQRLYSWSKNEIEKLLQDILNASGILSIPDVSSRKDYYLGNLTLNFNEHSKCYDIIDGQQRMTTLWLIGLVLLSKNTTANWKPFLTNGHSALLKFTAREDDNAFLAELLSRASESGLDIDFKRGSKVNLKMLEAIKTIDNYLSDNIEPAFLDAYSNYIFTKVKLAAIYLPNSIDLNKYFEDMNNRGIQLESHHILKARLLERIPKEYQKSYAQVWDAVSQTNQYLEYGFSATLKDSRKRLFDGNLASYFSKEINASENDRDTLKELIINAIDNEDEATKSEDEVEVPDKVISIINFPEFLLHTLRLFKNDDAISVDEKKLLKIYDEYLFEDDNKAVDAEEFIKHLLRCRVAFDKYFIKSVTTNEVTRWEIRDIFEKSDRAEYERKRYLDRKIPQFQSMLNASTDTSIWFTKALRKTLEPTFDVTRFLAELECIDVQNIATLPSLEELSRGVYTTRYWFYKLDYLLWLKWDDAEYSDIPFVQGIENLKERIRNFQFRDNRSVEHIQPQQPEKETWKVNEEEKLSKVKDSFGNLALISTSSNSSYNNQSPKDKRLDFVKRSNNWGIESLKLVSVYSKSDWSIETMREHEDEMMSVLVDAYNLKLLETCLA